VRSAQIVWPGQMSAIGGVTSATTQTGASVTTASIRGNAAATLFSP
jgi:hypothetical protein